MFLTKTLNVPDLFGKEPSKKSIIGIIPDFHFASFHSEIEPLILEYNPSRTNFLMLRFEGTNIEELTRVVNNEWKTLGTNSPFDFYFLSEGFAKLYKSDQKQKNLISVFSILALILAGLGLFGTTLFLVEQNSFCR